MPDDYEYDWQRPDDRSFDVGEVFNRALSAVRDNLSEILPSVSIIYFLLGIPIAMATYILRQEETGLGLVFVAGFVLIAAATILLQMALTIVFVQHQWGSPVSMPEAFEQSRARFWPTLVMLVLGALGMLCGLILFVVPGLFLYVAWYVALPVVVGERRDATDALDRSLHLTRGYRWPVAGVALLGLVIVFGVGGLLGGIGGTLSGPDAVGMDADAPVGRVILFSVFQSLGSTIGGVIGLALVASAYVELLAVRGEYDPDE